jgi:hypothetical protein
MKIKSLLLLVLIAEGLFGGDILRINKNDSTWQDFEISNIAKLTFTDYCENDAFRIHNADSTWQDENISSIDKLRFTDWYGFLSAPQNMTIFTNSSSVFLDWDKVEGADDYLVYRSATDPYSGFAKIDSTYTDDYQDTSVLAGSKYFYLIKARNSQ